MPFRDEPPGRPTVVALPVPRPYADWGKIVKLQDRRVVSRRGRRLRRLADQQERLDDHRAREARASRCAVQARHVCLLFKRFQSSATTSRGRTCARSRRGTSRTCWSAAARSTQREEVLALRNALAAIEWPDDELSVYATLRGPFFALGDDALLAFRHQHGRLHAAATSRRQRAQPRSPATWPPRSPCSARLHRGRNRSARSPTPSRSSSRRRARTRASPSGPPASRRSATSCACSIWRAASRHRAATSFRAFVDAARRRGRARRRRGGAGRRGGHRRRAHHDRAQGQGARVPGGDPGRSHGARDRATAVALRRSRRAGCGPMPLAGCAPVELLEQRDEVLEHDREEAVRLAYVAATRARELLVVPVVGDALASDEAASGWLDVLHPALFPKAAIGGAGSRRRGVRGSARTACASVPRVRTVVPRDAVRPGLHRPEVGKHRVVWWDPAVARARQAGRRRPAPAAHPGRRRRRGGRHRGRAPARRMAGASRVAARARHDAFAPRGHGYRADQAGCRARRAGAAGRGHARRRSSRPTAARTARPHGKRFGVLMHAILATSRLRRATRGGFSAIARSKAGSWRDRRRDRRRGHAVQPRAAASAFRARAARQRVPARVAHACSTCGRPLIEGVLNLAFREAARPRSVWTVVDFKTDVEMGERRRSYERQVALYADAVAAATGERASRRSAIGVKNARAPRGRIRARMS